jgi:hypothetical protein
MEMFTAHLASGHQVRVLVLRALIPVQDHHSARPFGQSAEPSLYDEIVLLSSVIALAVDLSAPSGCPSPVFPDLSFRMAFVGFSDLRGTLERTVSKMSVEVVCSSGKR